MTLKAHFWERLSFQSAAMALRGECVIAVVRGCCTKLQWCVRACSCICIWNKYTPTWNKQNNKEAVSRWQTGSQETDVMVPACSCSNGDAHRIGYTHRTLVERQSLSAHHRCVRLWEIHKFALKTNGEHLPVPASRFRWHVFTLGFEERICGKAAS